MPVFDGDAIPEKNAFKTYKMGAFSQTMFGPAPSTSPLTASAAPVLERSRTQSLKTPQSSEKKQPSEMKE